MFQRIMNLKIEYFESDKKKKLHKMSLYPLKLLQEGQKSRGSTKMTGEVGRDVTQSSS